MASYPYPFPDYPLGVFAALDDDHAVVIVGWDKIFEEIFTATGVEDESLTPENIELFQNYPNPFNPSTKIKFSIPIGTLNSVSLKVYDVLGNEVATLVNKELSAGNYELEFDASDLTSGIYFYKLKVGSPEGQAFNRTYKMVLLR
ncbi:MAG: T9SS type A sorting domain-containing protein [Bacteroidetes bacterium]|nr:T9SS type A sorting domain-containing protein [Bacteroidota bacterium]